MPPASGTIPAGWSSLPANNLTVSVLPNNLCGAVPKLPSVKLLFAGRDGQYSPLVNSLGSCFEECNNPVQSEWRGGR